MIDKDGIRNTVSIDRATHVPSAKTKEPRKEYTPNEFVDKRDNDVDEEAGKSTAERLDDVQ